MKECMIGLLFVCFNSWAFASGIPCEKKEYVELKDMTKEELAVELCNYKRRTEANQEMVQRYQDYSLMKDAEACLNELIKVERLYKKSFGEAPPECSE